MQPLTLCAHEVDAEPVFDALYQQLPRTMGISESDLACPTWEADVLVGAVHASQALANRLIVASFSGIQVRSFAAGTNATDINLVMWRWGPDRPTSVILIDDEDWLSGGPLY